MAKLIEKVYGRKVGGVRVVSMSAKIVLIFIIFLLVSNFSSNYINLIMNQAEQIKLINQLLIRDLKDLHVFASNQFEIYQYSLDEEDAIKNMTESAMKNLKRDHAVAFALTEDGGMFFFASEDLEEFIFDDEDAMAKMADNLAEEVNEDILNFKIGNKEYFGVYKYNDKWDVFIVRAEELKELYKESNRIFLLLSILIVVITILCSIVGIIIIRHILRYIRIMTDQIMIMENEQRLGLINLEGVVNDDVTYLGVAFNSLSNTIDNLVSIFKKFVARDVAARAYEEKDIRLEGVRKELAVLFTDIKGFTYMTETLGTDIIKLLNIHYDRAIKSILENEGDIGSIIGDALLAIYGVSPRISEDYNKCIAAIRSGYEVLNVAADLRREMYKYEAEIIRTRGYLTEAEKKVLKAVLIEVGVGIDGGQVFYGNIGSTDRMVNTVIGDNVNSASRLEGLTRFYKVPIICSDFVREEVRKDTDDYLFIELDTVQVKGKTIGKKVFWPLDKSLIDSDFKDQLDIFSSGLVEYYAGNWNGARTFFEKCVLPLKDVFLNRMKGQSVPENWNGIWTMKEK